MALIGSKNRPIAAIVAAVIVAFVLSFLSEVGVALKGPVEWLEDWKTTLLSNPVEEQRSDVAIVYVTEDTLAQYPYTAPTNRALLAALVREIDSAGPRAIGIDFIFDRPTLPQQDADFLDAVRSADAPVVIGAVDPLAGFLSKDGAAFHRDFLIQSGSRSGHIHFELTTEATMIGDSAVRYFPREQHEWPETDSFARVLAEVDGVKPRRGSRFIDWLLPPLSGADVFLSLRARSLPPIEPGSADVGLLPEPLRALLKDRIVLIGGEYTFRDQHPVPMTVDHGRTVPGVSIHAQAVAQIRDGRAMWALDSYVESAALFLVTLVAFWAAASRMPKLREAVIGAAGFVVLIAFDLISFKYFSTMIPASLLIAWTLGGLIGQFFKPSAA